MPVMYDQVRVKAKVTSSASGDCAFLEPSEVGGKSWFRGSEIKRFQDGDIIELVLQFNEKSRRLLKSVLLERSEEATQTEEKVVNQTEENLFAEGWHAGVYFESEAAEMFAAIHREMMSSDPTRNRVNALMVGPSGYGKTTLPEAYANEQGFKFLRINVPLVLDPEMWFGEREAVNGTTLFHPSDFTKTVTEGKAVIVLDEINRVESWIANPLFPILDHARRTTVKGNDIIVGPQVLFVMTANVGTRFSGTFNLDAAFTNRVDFTMEVGPLSQSNEVDLLQRIWKVSKKEAQIIVKLATHLREVVEKEEIHADVSTRTTLKLARAVSNGTLLRTAVKLIITNTIASDDRKPIIDAVNSIIGLDDNAKDAASSQTLIITKLEKRAKMEVAKILRNDANVNLVEVKQKLDAVESGSPQSIFSAGKEEIEKVSKLLSEVQGVSFKVQ